MSVLIKGMEMPQNCEECDVKAVCKNYWKLIRKQHTRPSWCPRVSVPPHGDLIDRDALPTSRVEWEDIVNAPTIIEAEEGE